MGRDNPTIEFEQVWRWCFCAPERVGELPEQGHRVTMAIHVSSDQNLAYLLYIYIVYYYL